MSLINSRDIQPDELDSFGWLISSESEVYVLSTRRL